MRRIRQIRVSEDLYLIMKDIAEKNRQSLYASSEILARKLKSEKKSQWHYFKL